MNSEERIECEKVWNQYIALMHKMCNLKLQSMPDEIEDVISEVFLAFCEKVETSGFPQDSKKWLYGTLNNIILKRYRSAGYKKEKTVDIPDIEGMKFNNDSKIEDIDDAFFVESIKKMCDEQLKGKEKQLFQYVFVDNMKMKDIAEVLHTSETAVRQKYYRLCLHIRKIVDKMM